MLKVPIVLSNLFFQRIHKLNFDTSLLIHISILLKYDVTYDVFVHKLS